MRCFPPRLPEQPIFYPVLNRDYAQQIAAQWNTKDSAGRATRVGFVTAFDLPVEYIERFEEHTVGSSLHRELWVPAEELDHLQRSDSRANPCNGRVLWLRISGASFRP